MICHINKIKDKNHMIILVAAGKVFDKNQHLLWQKFSVKWIYEGHIQHNKAIYDKPRAYTILNSKAFSSQIKRSREGCPFSPTLFKTVLEVLARAIR